MADVAGGAVVVQPAKEGRAEGRSARMPGECRPVAGRLDGPVDLAGRPAAGTSVEMRPGVPAHHEVPAHERRLLVEAVKTVRGAPEVRLLQVDVQPALVRDRAEAPPAS